MVSNRGLAVVLLATALTSQAVRAKSIRVGIVQTVIESSVEDNCNKLLLHDTTVDPDEGGMGANCSCTQETIPDVCGPRDPWDAGRSFGVAGAGDVDGDGHGDVLIGSILADPRVDPDTGTGTVNGGEAYLIYGFSR